MTYTFFGLEQGVKYFCRVSAYNSIGYGPSSEISSFTPVGQPNPPSVVNASIPSGSGLSLIVTWMEPDYNGGSNILGYEIEWFTKQNIREIQKITTSATYGILEIQVVKTSADSNSISGYFYAFIQWRSYGSHDTQYCCRWI